MEEDIKQQLKQEIRQEMKQEQKKKRIIKFIVLVTIVIIAVIIFVCIRNTRTTNNYEKKIISQEQFSQYITEIPITIENWQDYIFLENVETENKDAFGDIQSTAITTHFKLKNDNMYSNVVLKISVNNKEMIINNIDNHYTSYYYTPTYSIQDKNTDEKIYDYTITEKDFKCIDTKGSVYIIDIPNELWQTDIGDGKLYINVGDKDKYTTYWKDTYMQTLEQQKRNENADT